MAFTSNAAKQPKARPREGLHLRPLNVEKGTKRYSSADDSFPPQTATWRSNLIALSQRHNLLFVAYSHQIYVWEPSGPFQTLGNKPEMIITPVVKEPGGSGYISPATPHAINNILVDDLGREEVLLLVTDSGNICGYRVEAIFSALRRAAANKEDRPLDGTQVDPFFMEYVEASAWGLAIHKFARLIAVSANTGLITVFAFALVNPASGNSANAGYHPEDDEDFTDYGQTWLDIKNREQFVQLQHLMPYKHRTRNIRLTYTGHFANIPSVDFLNCDLDPNGTWMVSTDIDNKLLVWKIWESLGPFNVYHFNDISFKSFPETLRSDERGWTVLALDPRTFHLLKSAEEACGGPPQRRVKNGQTVFDLTRASSRIPSASQIYNYFPPAVKTEPEQPVLPDIFAADCCISRQNSISQTALSTPADLLDYNRSSTMNGSIRLPDSVDGFSHRAVDGSAYGDNLSRDGSDADQSTHNARISGRFRRLDDTDQQADTLPRQLVPGALTTPEFLQFALIEALGGGAPDTEYYDDDSMDDYSPDEDEYHDDQEMNDAGSSSGEGDTSTTAAGYQIFDPPAHSNFPILHFSHSDIRLIPHPFASGARVVCGDPLRQPFTHPIASIRVCDRFNMVKYIPEHGIVVAASQKGRAAIIALTESETTGLSFRIDWIVPFESQEKYGDRPLIPLLGMSVSPIQGFEIPPDVPCIPRDVKTNDLAFEYKYLNPDDSDNNKNTHTPLHNSSSVFQPHHSSDDGDSDGDVDTNDDETNHDPTFSYDAASDDSLPPPLTLPESHARATRAYQPEESWRGWNPSRRYRLLLMYADHTLMSYEFWYNWNTTDTPTPGTQNDFDEDDLLLV
ncbi:hypothetical protein BO70DRAFT_399209 [Aspergillus heteromorphus CBS 117.55]|uniref:Pyridine nucleotide-disulfide oxidoreductase family protein n=1 Tax=Aspergillus heteromorphus CBS 117.55 TaxID=1448321 RepID=A0A317VFW3_9EURO|nr:uncharacterized protein BO70DRAFT_399209 [Aspergillus heteromorphus CBS 117.55]PWY72329.1 hypothetical protein BO70DRAFT_399209 [Aspergillus heteromorphus CBS 117.55]